MNARAILISSLLPFLISESFASHRLALAQTGDIDELFSLSLKELVELEITTVSKREESLIKAPGVVSVITAEDIQSYGATNLKDVLLRIPNFYLFDSPSFKSSGMMLRAGATQHLNNHVLYLINGRPLREAQNGGLHSDMNLLFPVESIERIEIIRGPGSVLYGSNAYSGTLNVITKRPSEHLEVTLKTQNGTNGYSSQSLSLGSHYSEDVSIALYANVLDYDGITQPAQDELDVAGEDNTARDGEQIFIDSKIHDFSFSGFTNEINLPAVSGGFRWTGQAQFNLKRTFVDVEYQSEIFPHWMISANYSKNRQERNIIGPGDGGSEFLSDGSLSEISISGDISDDIKLISGALLDVVKGDLGIRGGDYETERHAIYAQIDHELNDKIQVTAGLQWNKPEGVDADVSPRLALVSELNEHWVAKALYAKAFRSPYGSEQFFDSPFLLGDDELKSEKIQTLEAQTIYNVDDLSLAFTVYYSETEDLIGRQIVDGTNTFVNLDSEISYSGIEIEWGWQFSNELRIQGNASYQLNEDEFDQEDVVAAANEMIKIGVTYHPVSELKIGVWNSYFGAANKLEEVEGSGTIVVNPESKSVNLLSLNVETNLGYLLDKTDLSRFTVSLFANNILDESVWYSELSRKIVNTYPQTHDQGIYGTLKYSF